MNTFLLAFSVLFALFVFASPGSHAQSSSFSGSGSGGAPPGSFTGSGSGGFTNNFAFSEAYTTLGSQVSALADIVGNMYQPSGFSSSCKSTVIGTKANDCITQLKSCSQTAAATATTAMISNLECPLQGLTSCMVEYSTCLLSFTAQASAVNATTCAWLNAMTAEVIMTKESNHASFDCYIFSYFLTKLHYNQCTPPDFYDSVCTAVANTIANKGANLLGSLSGFTVGQFAGVGLPRGMPPLVIRSKGNCSTSTSGINSNVQTTSSTSNGCSRTYFDGSCNCPDGGVAQRFDAFVPSYLTAAKNDTCKKAPSVFEFCASPSDANISFSVSNDTTSSSTTANRYAEELETTSSTTNQNCSSADQTPRKFRILSPDSNNKAVEKTLTVCADPNTNVFIVGTDGECYDARPNISSCNCDGARNNGFSLVYVNQSTNKSASGTLVVCNFDVAKAVSGQQIASTTLSALSALASGPAFAYMYLASTVSLIDCGKDSSTAAGAGGRVVIIPIRFPVDSPADGLYFALAVIFGLLILQFLGVFFIATYRFLTRQGVEKDPESPDMIFYSRRKPVYNPDEYEGKPDPTNNKKCADSEVKEVHDCSVIEVASASNDHGNEEEEEDKEVSSSIPPVVKEGEQNKEGENVFTIQNEDGETVVLRAPHKIQYKMNPTFLDYFSFQAGKFRLPSIAFIAAKMLYQGLSYESLFLMTRHTGTPRAVGIVGFVLSVLILAWYCYVGYLAHKLFRTEAYYEYTVGYQPSFSVVRFLGFKGMWNRRYKSVRQDAVFFGNFRGDSEHLWWSVPLPVARALLVSIIAGAPVTKAACSFVYYFLAAVLLLTGVLLLIVRADRSMIDVLTNAFLNIVLAVYLLMIVNNAGGLDIIYLVIVYAGSALAFLSIGLMVHEFLIVLPREMGNYIADDSDDEEDGVSDSDDNDQEMNSDCDDDDSDAEGATAKTTNPLAAAVQSEGDETHSPREDEEEKKRQKQERRQKRKEEKEAKRQQRAEERKVRRRQKAAQRRGCDGYVNFCASMW